MARLKSIYQQRRKWFLIQPENQVCPVMLSVKGERHQTNQIHHRAGRVGRMLLAEEFWLAVSAPGHEYIHSHVAEAYAKGWMLSRK